MKSLYLYILAFFIMQGVLIHCKSDKTNESNLLLAALVLANQQANVPFSLTNNGSEISCGQKFTLGGDSNVEIRDFRFYLSEFAWITASGEIEATLPDIENWQSRNVVLIDLEDGTGLCSSGTAETNSNVVLSPPPAGATGIAFSVGLPEEINKLNNGTAEAPFNLPAMYWSWSNGYKFTKIELSNGADIFNFHLGSRECTGNPFTSCSKPLKGRVRLTTNNTSAGIQFDLAQWWSGAFTAQTCMGNDPGDPCTTTRTHVGVNNATGGASAENQKAFSAKQ